MPESGEYDLELEIIMIEMFTSYIKKTAHWC